MKIGPGGRSELFRQTFKPCVWCIWMEVSDQLRGGHQKTPCDGLVVLEQHGHLSVQLVDFQIGIMQPGMKPMEGVYHRGTRDRPEHQGGDHDSPLTFALDDVDRVAQGAMPGYVGEERLNDVDDDHAALLEQDGTRRSTPPDANGGPPAQGRVMSG